MLVLGLSFDYHDAAAALILDGKVLAAIQEERLSRSKNDPGFPAMAIAACLEIGGISAQQLDAVVFYENPVLKFDRIYQSTKDTHPTYLIETLGNWIASGKFSPRTRIANSLGIDKKKIYYSEHHLSHAASAFLCSPFERAAILTVDGVGEYETATISVGEGSSIEKLHSSTFPYSLGLLYSAMTAYLGFEVNEGEYKVMGMASYGQPCCKEKIRQLYQVDSIGLPKLNDEYFDLFSGERFPFTTALTTLMGPPREPESPFDPEQDPESLRFADIAASLQAVTEDIYLELCRIALQKTSAPALCLAGGVALNSKANMRLQQALKVPLFVQPAAGDAGGALGAALGHYHSSSPQRRIPSQFNPFLGKAYSSEEILKAIHQADIVEYKTFENDADLLTTVATLLAQGKVVGWLNGRSEWGPRSLGARSILADPRNAVMKETVNSRIKFREAFRPFAPSVLAEHAGEYYSCPEPPPKAGPEDFMLSVATAKPIAQEKIPAVVHVDGTSRLQTVRSETNPRFHALISAFQTLTGLPVLLNTSFNRRGEPIVDSPEDAINTFLWTDIDILVMENVLLDKQTL